MFFPSQGTELLGLWRWASYTVVQISFSCLVFCLILASIWGSRILLYLRFGMVAHLSIVMLPPSSPVPLTAETHNFQCQPHWYLVILGWCYFLFCSCIRMAYQSTVNINSWGFMWSPVVRCIFNFLGDFIEPWIHNPFLN